MKLKTDTTWTIKALRAPATGEYTFMLLGPDGSAHHHAKPRTLAKRAWAEGADAVVHDYDLNLDPEK